VTDAERQAALEQIADEVRVCTRCRLHQQRTRAVPGEGNPDTEVVFVGEGPGFNEDRDGRPFVGRAGALLVRLLASVGWRREDVFITNVVKCRPPDNRDPSPDEIAACAPFLRRQLQVLDPALVVTLGRFSMGTFMPGARISQAHGTKRPVDPATGAPDALAYAMYHPAAALRATDVEAASFRDMAGVPGALLESRDLRERHRVERANPEVSEVAAPTPADTAAATIADLSAGTPPDLPQPPALDGARTPEESSPPARLAAPEPLPGPDGGSAVAGTTASPAIPPERPAAMPATIPIEATSVTPATVPIHDPEPSTDQLTLF
jgi:DNA polymerase